MSKTLVTGGGGFIGGALAAQLNAFAWTHAHGDLRDPNNCEAACRGMEVVYHTASVTAGAGVVKADPMHLVSDNLIMFAQMMRAASKAGVKKFIYMSSTTGYPEALHLVREYEYHQGQPPDCYWPIGTTKRYMENLAKMYSAKGMTTVAIRASNIYGPGDCYDPIRSHVIPATVRKVAERQDPITVWGDGEDVRDAIYITDAVEAIVRCESLNGCYSINLALGKGYTVSEILNILLNLEGYKPAIICDTTKPSLLKSRLVAADYAENLLGWRATTSMEEGLAKTLAWYHGR